MKIYSKRIENHRSELIHLYEQQIIGESPYMKFVLQKALRELYIGTRPRKVENFVVKMEKISRNKI